MKKIAIAVILIILAGAILFLAKNNFRKNNPPVPEKNISTDTPAGDNKNSSQNIPNATEPAQNNQDIVTKQNPSGFVPPLDRAAERVTKKPFGIYITPKTSPVQPEKFQGFHTGTDFEIFPEELNIDVPVRAICSGKIAVKRSADGYGGVLVQNCTLDNQAATIIYGHLKLTSISKNAGDTLNAGDQLGILGKAGSVFCSLTIAGGMSGRYFRSQGSSSRH